MTVRYCTVTQWCTYFLACRKKPIESDRLIVYCQPMPRQAEALPAAKVLVTPVEYVPEKITNTTAEIAGNL
jgi:hypothetical protein